MVRHLLSLNDLTPDEIMEIIEISIKIKDNPSEFHNHLKNKTLAMFFEKPSLRTRVSFEVAMSQLGGHAIYLAGETIHKKESAKDFSIVLSRYVDFITARVFSHKTLESIKEHSKVPLINALSDFYHPCQTLADMMTIYEHKKKLKGLNMAYIGDGGCNTAHSTILGCSKLELNLNIACPEKPIYNPKKEVMKSTDKVKIFHNPIKAAENADVIYTDVWVSMGDEKEVKERMRDFGDPSPPFQVNKNVVQVADKDVIVMHCLPAIRGSEITDEVIDGPHSVVYDQAENRLHAQKGLLVWLTKKCIND